MLESNPLDPLRLQIDTIDEQLVDLLNKRASIAFEIGKIKKRQAVSLYAPEREKQILDRLTQINPGPFPNGALGHVFRAIMGGTLSVEEGVDETNCNLVDTMKPHERLANLPVYIPGKPIEQLKREYGIVDAIKLASNENPLRYSKKAIAALKSGINEVYRYPDGAATLLREGIAHKWGVQTNQVIVGNGSDEIIALLTRTLLLPGDEVIMANPSFAIYHLTTLAAHCKPVFIPLTSSATHDLSSMANAITDKTRLIFICNPNNPTGTIVQHEAVARFIKKVPQSIWVVFDEAYAEYATDPAYPSSIQLLQEGFPIIFLRTFSKIYGLAGLRIGYGIGPLDRIDLLNRVRQPFNANLLAQRAALAALSDTDHVKASVELNEKGKQYLYEQFDRMGIHYLPTEANFICFYLYGSRKETQDEQETFAKGVYEALLRQGVIIRHIEGPCLRVTLGKLGQMKRFIRSLQKVLIQMKEDH